MFKSLAKEYRKLGYIAMDGKYSFEFAKQVEKINKIEREIAIEKIDNGELFLVPFVSDFGRNIPNSKVLDYIVSTKINISLTYPTNMLMEESWNFSCCLNHPELGKVCAVNIFSCILGLNKYCIDSRNKKEIPLSCYIVCPEKQNIPLVL